MKTLSRKEYLILPPPQTGDVVADKERLCRELEKTLGKVAVSSHVLKRDYRNFRQNNWKVTATLVWNGNIWEVTAIESGNTEKSHYGFAVDLGSTMIAMSMVDLNNGQILAEAAIANPQIAFGMEILSRIFYGKDNEEHLKDLQEAVIVAFHELMATLQSKTGISCKTTSVMVVGGNTTMIHFLLGMDAFPIFMTPFAPVFNHTGFIYGEELHLQTNAVVYAIPSIANYLGGDIISGLIAVDMLLENRLCLYMDIGTNGEMVIGNKDYMFAGAGAAGPALEGGVSKFGMRAVPGAVNTVVIKDNTLEITTIDHEKPKGICGSGIVDLLSEMLIHGWMDKQGKLNFNATERIQKIGKETVVVYALDTESADGQNLYFSEKDIMAFRDGKAAANTMVECLLEAAEIKAEDIDVLYIAGGFGQYINVESAINIGMYPDLPLDHFQVVGNGSLKGAYKMLVDQSYLSKLADITNNIYYLEFGMFPNFISKMMAASFFPHTDLEKYPSVMAKLKK